MITNPFVFATLALLLYGLWAFFAKMSTLYIEPKAANVFAGIGVIITTAIIFFLTDIKSNLHPKGIFYASLVGVFGMLGTLALFYALQKGKASVVIPFAALYPVVAIILSILVLKETLTLPEGLGILFAIMAMVLFSL